MLLSGKKRKDCINAVTGELMSRYGMTHRQAKRTVSKSPLRRVMKLYPDEVEHSSVASLADDIMAGMTGA